MFCKSPIWFKAFAVGLFAASCLFVASAAAIEQNYFSYMRNSVIPGTNGSSVAYCGALDIILILSGCENGSSSSDPCAYLYSYDLEATVPLPSISGIATQFGNLVPLNSTVDNVCRFLYFGGYRKVNQVVVSSTAMHLIDIEFSSSNQNYVANNSALKWTVDTTSDMDPAGIAEGAAVAYGNQVFVVGGVIRDTTSSLEWNYGVWRFDPVDFSNGIWSMIIDMRAGYSDTCGFSWYSRTAYKRRQFASATQGSAWIIFGGLTTPPGQTLRSLSSVGSFNLDDLLNSPVLAEAWRPICFQSGDSSPIYRWSHNVQIHDDYIISYDGQRLVFEISGRARVASASSYVLITKLDIDEHSAECTLSGTNGAWCGSNTSHLLPPEDSTYFSTSNGIKRKDGVLFLHSINDADGMLLQINASRLINSSGFFNALQADTDLDSGSSMGFYTNLVLEYTLVFVCVTLVVFLFIVFGRQRLGLRRALGIRRGQDSRIPIEVVREIPFCLYDPEKHDHMLVDVFFNLKGSPVVKRKLGRVSELKTEDEYRKKITEDQDMPSSSLDPSDSNEASLFKLDASSDVHTDQQCSPTENVNEEGDSPNNEKEICAICLFDFERGDLLHRLHCEHIFHWDCVEPWLVENGSCPHCRIHIVTQRVDEQTESEEGSQDDLQDDSADSNGMVTLTGTTENSIGAIELQVMSGEAQRSNRSS